MGIRLNNRGGGNINHIDATMVIDSCCCCFRRFFLVQAHLVMQRHPFPALGDDFALYMNRTCDASCNLFTLTAAERTNVLLETIGNVVLRAAPALGHAVFRRLRLHSERRHDFPAFTEFVEFLATVTNSVDNDTVGACAVCKGLAEVID